MDKNMINKKKNKKEFNDKKLPRSFKAHSLPDAIVEQKFLGKIGSEIVVGRFRNGKETLSICLVKEIEESGFINTWDETSQQWYAFTIEGAPKLVKLYN